MAKDKSCEILDEALLDSILDRYGRTDGVDFDKISMDWCRIFSRVDWDIPAEGTRTGRHGTVSGSACVTDSPPARLWWISATEGAASGAYSWHAGRRDAAKIHQQPLDRHHERPAVAGPPPTPLPSRDRPRDGGDLMPRRGPPGPT
uniref:Uncharacterized protein n=1 Tax=Streptomyces sp. NBC_00093 TaxID=2975649 RepID=A0AAU2ABQ1_9ACTN